MQFYKLALEDLVEAFFVKRFASKKLFISIISLFSILVIMGGYFFGFQSGNIAYTPTWEYHIFIKLVPKVVLFFIIVIYNFNKNKEAEFEKYNKTLYFLVSCILIFFLFVTLYLIKEFVGTLAHKAIDWPDIKTEEDDCFKCMNNPKTKLIINLPWFFILSIPAIVLTAYFQLVISNYAYKILYHTFRRK